MKAKKLVIFGAAATVVFTMPSLAFPKLSSIPEQLATPVAATKADLAKAEQSAKAAQAAIRASRADTTALAKAVKAKDESGARALLQKHGFSARELEGAKIVLVDATRGGESQRTKVTIEASCCPLTITIIIRV